MDFNGEFCKRIRPCFCGTFRPQCGTPAPQLFTFHSSLFTCSTVGYINENITKGKFNALGIPFTAVDGKGFQLNSISSENLYSGGTFFTSDQIQIWNPTTSGYENWYWYADDSHEYDGWYDQITGEIAFETVHPDGLEPGSAVWFLSHANSNGGPAAFPGAVEGAATYTVTLYRGKFNQFGNPYPIAFKFNDLENIDWSNAISGGTFFTSDQIQIWNPATSGYENWYWYADDSHEYDGWYDQITGEIPFESVHPDGLPAGTPVWYLAKGTAGETFDVTFKSPLK